MCPNFLIKSQFGLVVFLELPRVFAISGRIIGVCPHENHAPWPVNGASWIVCRNSGFGLCRGACPLQIATLPTRTGGGTPSAASRSFCKGPLSGSMSNAAGVTARRRHRRLRRKYQLGPYLLRRCKWRPRTSWAKTHRASNHGQNGTSDPHIYSYVRHCRGQHWPLV